MKDKRKVSVTYKSFLYRNRARLTDGRKAWAEYNESFNEEYRKMDAAAKSRYADDTYDERFTVLQNEMKKKKAERERKYLRDNQVRQVMVKFNRSREDERELFDYLFAQGNMQGYLKKLLRDDMDKRE